MHAGLHPYRAFRGQRGQWGEQPLLGLGKQRQRARTGAAVDAVTRLSHQPLAQLVIGMGEIAKLAQRHEARLDVFHAGFNAALLLRVSRRAGQNTETISGGQLRIGALHLGLVITGPRDGALRVVDHHRARHAVEPLEGVAVTGEPGVHLLVAHDLAILVAAPGKRHHEDPGLHRRPLAGHVQ